MKKNLFSVVLTVMFTVCSCNAIRITGDGNITTAERQLSAFEGIKIAVPANVQVHLGSAPRVVIKTDANLMEYIITEVRGNTLLIKEKDNSNIHFTKFEVEIYTQTLTATDVAGSGNVTIVDEVRTASFDATIAGSGELRGTLHCTEKLDASIAGSGDIVIAGSSKELKISIAGSGDFSCTQCETQTAKGTLPVAAIFGS
jgi:hypothetical protein